MDWLAPRPVGSAFLSFHMQILTVSTILLREYPYRILTVFYSLLAEQEQESINMSGIVMGSHHYMPALQ